MTESAAIPVETVACHSRETLRLVQTIRLLDDILKRSPSETRERIRRELLAWAERGRDIARENLPLF